MAQANFWITTVCRQQEVPGIQAKTLGKMGLRGVSQIFFWGGEGVTMERLCVVLAHRKLEHTIAFHRFRIDMRVRLHEEGESGLVFWMSAPAKWWCSLRGMRLFAGLVAVVFKPLAIVCVCGCELWCCI